MLTLRLNANRHAASRTGTPATSVHSVPLPRNRRHQVAAHESARRGIKSPQRFVVECCSGLPRIKPVAPERLALIDVADACAYALIQQELAEHCWSQASGAPNDLVKVERIG
jgi:hypothetical protein